MDRSRGVLSKILGLYNPKKSDTSRPIHKNTSRGSNQSQRNSSCVFVGTSSSNENSNSSFEILRESAKKNSFPASPSPRASQEFKVLNRILKVNEKTLGNMFIGFLSLKRPQEAEIDLSNFKFDKDEIQQLEAILKQISHIRSLKLIIRNQEKGSTGAIIKQLENIFDNRCLRSLESLKLDFFRSQVAAECLDFFNREVFPRLNSVKTFHMNLFGCALNNQVIQELAQKFKENFAAIEDFSCNLGLTMVAEKGIIEFFHEMPKLKHFEMNIGNCEFTDEGMRIFIQNMLRSMTCLESFVFKFEATDVMSAQILELIKNLPVTIKKLYLDLRFTKTTKEVLKFFIHEKLLSLKGLEEAELKVENTLASKKVMNEIELINKRYAKKINIEECMEYERMVKERYLASAKKILDSREKEFL